jgi:hypothetical protein
VPSRNTKVFFADFLQFVKPFAGHTVGTGKTIKVKMAKAGGYVAHIKPSDNDFR